MATNAIGAGFRYIFYAVSGTYGAIGNTATGATAGAAAGQPALRLEGAQTIPVAIPEPEVVTASGDDEPLVQFEFAAEDLPNGILEVQVLDPDFHALIQGTLVRALADFDFTTLGPTNPSKPDMTLILMRRAKTWDPASRGSKRWEIFMIPKCTVTPLGTDITQRAVGPYRYQFVTSKSDVHAFGASFTEGADGTTSAPIVHTFAENPLHLHPFKGNNAQTTFTLAYTPKSVDKVVVTVNGVVQTYTTHYTISGTTVTFVAAPGTDATINVLYEVDESILS